MTSLKDRLPTTIRTERLVLTAPVLAHAPAIAQLANNANVHRWMARLPFPYALSDAEFFITKIARGDTEFAWSILAGETFIGTVGLHLQPDMAPELGYWLGEPYWGHGYATEAARAVIAAARAAGASELRSRALSDNARSLHVLTKAGFIETGKGPEPVGTNQGTPATFLRLDLSR